MDSLRIDNGLKKIEVNDAGECIEFSIASSDFFRSFFELLRWFEEQENRKEIKEMEDRKEMVVSEGGTINYDIADSFLDLRDKIIKEACEKVDNIFGSDASRKIFGSRLPDVYMIADFFEKVSPFIKKYQKERNQAIDKKYSKDRKGSKS